MTEPEPAKPLPSCWCPDCNGQRLRADGMETCLLCSFRRMDRETERKMQEHVDMMWSQLPSGRR